MGISDVLERDTSFVVINPRFENNDHKLKCDYTNFMWEWHLNYSEYDPFHRAREDACLPSSLTTRYGAKVYLWSVKLEGGSNDHTLYLQDERFWCTSQLPLKVFTELTQLLRAE